jgi:taurine dioxygenase
MGSITVKPLQADLAFGARISGVTAESIKDDSVRQQINEVFEDRGVILFENLEPSIEMQSNLSQVFGELKDHPNKDTKRVDGVNYPGVIEIAATPDMCIVEIKGKPLISWQPWHFDHCYTNQLNRGGVLRAVQIPPNDGLTRFADGIQIYNDMSPDIRAKVDELNIIYTLDLIYTHQRFGLPETFRQLRPYASEARMLESAAALPRAIHPAVWTRATGEKVAHMGPYMAVGIEGMENPEGEALFREVWAEITRVMRPYEHSWKSTDMLIWDNWRVLHEAGGCNPEDDRIMHRTTIAGDYGFGRFETDAPPAAVSAMA